MDFRQGFIHTIGNTPLIKLKKASEETGCTILGKAEFLNPGGSVKDRAALWIIKDAEERGQLRPGGVIVEGTAGNTGIGLALVGNARGYRTVIVMPETQSQEKKDMLLLCGADLRLVPAVPYSNPNNYVRFSGRLAEELAAKEPNGAIWRRRTCSSCAAPTCAWCRPCPTPTPTTMCASRVGWPRSWRPRSRTARSGEEGHAPPVRRRPAPGAGRALLQPQQLCALLGSAGRGAGGQGAERRDLEKKDMLLLCGADLRLVPAVPYSNPNNYVRFSGRLAEELAAKEPNGAIWRRRTCSSCAAPTCAWCRPCPTPTPTTMCASRVGWPRSWRPRSRTARSGEEGHAPPVRRRPAPGAGRALLQPQQLCALLGSAGRGAGGQGAERRDL